MADRNREYTRLRTGSVHREMRIKFEELEKRLAVWFDRIQDRLTVLNNHEEKMKDMVRKLEESRALLQGKADQKSVNYAYLLAIIAALLSMAALIAEGMK